MQQITTFLTFNDQAEAAVRFYTSTFPGSRIVNTRNGPDGRLMTATFEIAGQQFIALNGGPSFTFSQGISLFVRCDTQQEIDHLWGKLADGGREIACGWVTDRFGVTWQIVPRVLGEMLGDQDAAKAGRAMQAMLKMKKLDIAELKRAYEGKQA